MSFTTKFYISDSHFGHFNIIDHCDRPFRSAAEMDEFMVRQWNEAVGATDIVYHLGDFAYRADPERVGSIFSRLNGRKRLVLGNHDLDKKGRPHKWLLDLDWDDAPTPMIETTDGGELVVLCHYQMRTWRNAGRGSWHFFGHSHGNAEGFGRSRDVGVDLPDVAFRPRTFAELTAAIRKAEKEKEAAQ